MDERGMFQGVKDAVHAVLHWQDKAGRQLTQSAACVHKCGRIGQEFELRHHIVKYFLHFLCEGCTFIFLFRPCNMVRHSSKHLLGGLYCPALGVLFKIPPFKNSYCVFREGRLMLYKDRLAKPDGRGLGKPVFQQLGLDYLLYHRHGYGVELHLGDLLAQEPAHVHGLVCIDWILPDQQVRKSGVIPHVGA